MSYTTYDFEETLNAVGIEKESIAHVIAAWGRGGDMSDWEGGFLLKLRDDRVAYATGWCDTSGWGCQDGGDIYYYAGTPLTRAQLPSALGPASKLGVVEWDESPADLNGALEPAAERDSAG